MLFCFLPMFPKLHHQCKPFNEYSAPLHVFQAANTSFQQTISDQCLTKTVTQTRLVVPLGFCDESATVCMSAVLTFKKTQLFHTTVLSHILDSVLC